MLGLDGDGGVVEAGILISPLAGNLDGAEHGRHLHDGAGELRQRLLEQGGGDVLVGVVVVDGTLEVVAGGGGAQHHGAGVDFVAVLQLRDGLGGLTQTDEEEAGGQGVEGAGVTYFELFKAVGAAHYGLNFVYRLEGGPLARFVDGQDDACLQLFEGYHST